MSLTGILPTDRHILLSPSLLPPPSLYFSLVSKRAAGWKQRNQEETQGERTKVDRESNLWLSTCSVQVRTAGVCFK